MSMRRSAVQYKKNLRVGRSTERNIMINMTSNYHLIHTDG